MRKNSELSELVAEDSELQNTRGELQNARTKIQDLLALQEQSKSRVQTLEEEVRSLKDPTLQQENKSKGSLIKARSEIECW